MSRSLGILKVVLVLAVDFAALCSLFQSPWAASAAVGILALYVLFGGYPALLREGAVGSAKLPAHQRRRLEAAKAQLTADIRSSGGSGTSGLKLYLVRDDDELNATAYGSNCISVTRGTLDYADPLTLNAVLAHEVSHIQNLDPEFNRAVFCSVTLLMAALSILSFAAMAVIFVLFLALSCFRSWLGLLAFRGTTMAVGGIFGLIQRGIVAIYRTLLSLVSRRAEYRCDRYSCQLGYGVQLAHFLSVAAPADGCRLTLAEALYRTHPPASKRIARLEQLLAQRVPRSAARRVPGKPRQRRRLGRPAR